MRISSYLEQDHRRIENVLRLATDSAAGVDLASFSEFRGALLRHIGMEEKILFPAIRAATHGSSLPGVEQLHLDHGALAALLVPTPTKAILNTILMILRRHNVIEEGPEGIYGQFERLSGIDAEGILSKLQTFPPVPVNPHVDNQTAIDSMHAAVGRAGYSLDLDNSRYGV